MKTLQADGKQNFILEDVMPNYTSTDEFEKYREYFVKPFAPIFRGAVLRTKVKSMKELSFAEQPGLIHQNMHYVFDEYYIKDHVYDMVEVGKKLMIYKPDPQQFESDNIWWGVLPLRSLLSGNEETKVKEISLADSFYSIWAYGGIDLRLAGLDCNHKSRDEVNDLDFFKLYDPSPDKTLLEKPADLSQFIVMPERLQKPD